MSCTALLLALYPCALQGDLAPTLRAEARVEADVAALEVGEPFTLRLLVRHAQGDAPAIEAAYLEVDPTWAVLGGSERTTLPDPAGEGLAATRASWRVCSLEPGMRELPAPRVTFTQAGGERETCEVVRASVEVQAVLAPGEDEPRPLGGFLGLGPRPQRSIWLRAAPWIAAAALLVASAWVWRARRRRGVRATAAPTPLERLAALEELGLERPEAVVAAHVELARALREHVDGALGESPAGLTDREWSCRLSQRIGAERARPIAELLAACEPVKYGAERPTHWAARERIARARELATAAVQARASAEVAR